MCGRFSQSEPVVSYMRVLDPGWSAGSDPRHAEPNWNICPSQRAWAVVERNGKYLPRRLVWGFPSRRPGVSGARPLINARSETAAVKPSFRRAWRAARCVLPADHYYEWQARPARGGQPFCVRKAAGGPLLLAGLRGHADGSDLFVILTAAAYGGLAAVHHRMPVAFCAPDARRWLSPSTPGDGLGETVASALGGAQFVWHPVSAQLGDPRNNGPGVADAVPATGEAGAQGVLEGF